ncbi:MAG: division/cell wall cluster transcriptional repressor MraZ [Dysgonamonadaceae bacterium]|jgi:MraZ protein|nr:division/cell wall cluster transcriptional repressor MraZ [Dysgonamonadaceae bacterium]
MTGRFTGSIDAKMDVKGRVFVPAAFRKILQKGEGEHLMMRKDIYQECLVLYPKQSWEAELNRLREKLNRYNEEHQQFYRQFVMDSEVLEMDSNGRILIPKRYLQKINLSKEVRFLGMDDVFEIWDRNKLEKPLLDSETFKESAARLLSR